VSRGPVAWFLAWAARLRFPWLFLLTAAIFLVNLAVPDALPFVDEILLGLVAALLASLKRRRRQPGAEAEAPRPRDQD
jgi:hypothetical protein